MHSHPAPRDTAPTVPAEGGHASADASRRWKRPSLSPSPTREVPDDAKAARREVGEVQLIDHRGQANAGLARGERRRVLARASCRRRASGVRAAAARTPPGAARRNGPRAGRGRRRRATMCGRSVPARRRRRVVDRADAPLDAAVAGDEPVARRGRSSSATGDRSRCRAGAARRSAPGCAIRCRRAVQPVPVVAQLEVEGAAPAEVGRQVEPEPQVVAGPRACPRGRTPGHRRRRAITRR